MDEEEIKKLLSNSEARVEEQNKPVIGGSNKNPFFHDRDKKRIGIEGGAPYIDYFGNKYDFNTPDLYVDYSKERNIGDARQSGQVFGLGFGDEIEATVRSMFDDEKTYAQKLPEIREKINQYKKSNPNAVLTTNILAGLVQGPAYVAKTGLKTAGRVIGGGTITGAGVSDPESYLSPEQLTEENVQRVRREGGVFGSLFSLPFAFLSKVFQPNQIAQQLQNKRVNVTPGMMSGGEVKGIEDLLSGLPGSSTGVAKAKKDSLMNFNIMAYREILGDLNNALKQTVTKNVNMNPIKGVIDDPANMSMLENVAKGVKFDTFKLVKGGDGNAQFKNLNDVINKTYTKLLNNITVSGGKQIKSEVDAVINNYKNLLPKNFSESINKVLFNRFKGDKLTGENLKLARQDIRLRANDAKLSKENNSNELADAYADILKILKQQITDQNPNVAPQFLAFEALYPKYQAILKAKTATTLSDGYFTPDQLIQAGNAVANKTSTTKVALDEAFFGDVSKKAKNIGIDEAESKTNAFYTMGVLAGTGGYGYSQDGLEGAGTGIAAGLALPFAIGAGYKNPAIRNMLTNSLRGGFMPGSSPYMSDVLRNRTMPRRRF